MKNEILSPLTGKNDVVLEREIDTSLLMNEYHRMFGLDITYLFNGVKAIKLFRCAKTGYRFYYPYSIAGDDHFYQHLSKYGWYYLSWKWEHQQCLDLLEDGDSLLEVGSGRGAFLENVVKQKKVKCVGLELNREAVGNGVARGISLINEKIQTHSVKFPRNYDIVCSFQVLEHIPEVHEVINSMLECVRPGGKLLISVPNNDSFIRNNPLPSRILNMPPHHMGLWNEASLQNLEKIFPVVLKKILIEPLEPIHLDTWLYTRIYHLLLKSSFLTRAFWKLKLHVPLRPVVRMFARYVQGHSIIAILEKLGENGNSK